MTDPFRRSLADQLRESADTLALYAEGALSLGTDDALVASQRLRDAAAALAAPSPQWQPKRPKIICLCGSSRFVAEMAVFAWELEKGGAIVLSLHLLPSWYPGLQADHQAETEGIAAQMDELHKRKIDLADEIFVMNVGGYIGDSTRSEIAYATEHGKPIGYLVPLPAPPSEAP